MQDNVHAGPVAVAVVAVDHDARDAAVTSHESCRLVGAHEEEVTDVERRDGRREEIHGHVDVTVVNRSQHDEPSPIGNVCQGCFIGSEYCRV